MKNCIQINSSFTVHISYCKEVMILIRPNSTAFQGYNTSLIYTVKIYIVSTEMIENMNF